MRLSLDPENLENILFEIKKNYFRCYKFLSVRSYKQENVEWFFFRGWKKDSFFLEIVKIIIKSRCQHEFPGLSLSLSLSLPLSLSLSLSLSLIHRTQQVFRKASSVGTKFLLVGQIWHVHMKGSIEERH